MALHVEQSSLLTLESHFYIQKKEIDKNLRIFITNLHKKHRDFWLGDEKILEKFEGQRLLTQSPCLSARKSSWQVSSAVCVL